MEYEGTLAPPLPRSPPESPSKSCLPPFLRSLGASKRFQPRPLEGPRRSPCGRCQLLRKVWHHTTHPGHAGGRSTHPSRSVIWASLRDEVWVPEPRVIHIPHHPLNQLPHFQPRRRGSIGHVCAILRPNREGRGQFRRGRESKQRWVIEREGERKKGGDRQRNRGEVSRAWMEKRWRTVMQKENVCPGALHLPKLSHLLGLLG